MRISLEPYIAKYFQQTPKQLSCMKEFPKAFGIALPVAYLYPPPQANIWHLDPPPPIPMARGGPDKQ